MSHLKRINKKYTRIQFLSFYREMYRGEHSNNKNLKKAFRNHSYSAYVTKCWVRHLEWLKNKKKHR